MRDVRSILGAAILLISCGGRFGDLPTCEDYCQRLRTSEGGCAGEVEECERDCELWRRENVDQGCEGAFDDVLACTADTAEVCTANREQCSPEWDHWSDCVNRCDIASVGDVTFEPACTADAPCSSGTELTMSYPGPINCTSLAVVTCAGDPTFGFLPASDAISSGTIELSCTQPSTCGLQTHTAFLLSSGGATVANCTP
jgi:hypothetical protein